MFADTRSEGRAGTPTTIPAAIAGVSKSTDAHAIVPKRPLEGIQHQVAEHRSLMPAPAAACQAVTSRS